MGLLSQRKKESNGDEKTNVEFTEILKRQLDQMHQSTFDKDQPPQKKDEGEDEKGE